MKKTYLLFAALTAVIFGCETSSEEAVSPEELKFETSWKVQSGDYLLDYSSQTKQQGTFDLSKEGYVITFNPDGTFTSAYPNVSVKNMNLTIAAKGTYTLQDSLLTITGLAEPRTNTSADTLRSYFIADFTPTNLTLTMNKQLYLKMIKEQIYNTPNIESIGLSKEKLYQLTEQSLIDMQYHLFLSK